MQSSTFYKSFLLSIHFLFNDCTFISKRSMECFFCQFHICKISR